MAIGQVISPWSSLYKPTPTARGLDPLGRPKINSGLSRDQFSPNMRTRILKRQMGLQSVNPAGTPLATTTVNPPVDPNRRPTRPVWESLLDPTGRIQSQYRVGDSANWRNLMQERLNQRAAQAQTGVQANTQNLLQNLAMRGGLSGGTRERLTQQGVRQGALAAQNVLGQRLGVDIRAEELDRSADQFNIQAALREIAQKRIADMNAYNEQMRAWAAMQTADEIPTNTERGGVLSRVLGDFF